MLEISQIHASPDRDAFAMARQHGYIPRAPGAFFIAAESIHAYKQVMKRPAVFIGKDFYGQREYGKKDEGTVVTIRIPVDNTV
ncbi:MAG: hypothetical protein J5822_02210 [Eubacteriaceae bacterium]|nr:hypothetical protein [Eubacteriaceae bacterium]